MGELLPIFPLPTVVLFPNVFLPLHIFEPRYCEMVADALASDRLIGMALLRPGWEDRHRDRPDVFPVCCSGVITHVDPLPDGRYNIVLRGVERVRILREDYVRSYRRALVEPLADDDVCAGDRASVKQLRAKLDALLAPAESLRGDTYGTAAMRDEDLVNALAQYMDLDPLEKQALLELDGLRRRAESLIELIEMKVLIARTPGLSKTSH